MTDESLLGQNHRLEKRCKIIEKKATEADNKCRLQRRPKSC